MADAFLALPRGDVEPDRLAERVGERLLVALGGPELQLRVAGNAEPNHETILLLAQVQRADGLGVAPVESLRKTNDAGEQLHGPAQTA
jgi:hypothetical protein